MSGQMGAGAMVAQNLLVQILTNHVLDAMSAPARFRFQLGYQSRLNEHLAALVAQAEASKVTLSPELTVVPTDA